MLFKNIKHLQEVLIQVLFLVSIPSTMVRISSLPFGWTVYVPTHPHACPNFWRTKNSRRMWKTSKVGSLKLSVDILRLAETSLIHLEHFCSTNQSPKQKIGEKNLRGPYSHCDPLRQLLIAALSPDQLIFQHMANSFSNPWPTHFPVL